MAFRKIGALSICALSGAQSADIDAIAVSKSPLGTVPAEFLSVNMDAGQFFSGHFWHEAASFPFKSTAFLSLAKELAPAIFRIGGTEADQLWYDVRGCFDSDFCDGQAKTFKEAVSLENIDALFGFAKAAGFEVAFGLNAGKATRDQQHRWKPDNAEELVSYVAKTHADLSVWWELGNEPEGWFLFQKMFVSGAQLARDMKELQQMVKRVAPLHKTAGIDTAGGGINKLNQKRTLLTGFLENDGASYIDALTYHYYPYIGASADIPEWAIGPLSNHVPFLLTQAKSVGPAFDLVEYKLAYMQNLTKDLGRPLWLGETALAAGGGRDGVTNRFASSLFYLFELGQAAVTGHAGVMRQALTGASYSLVDINTLEPMPDFWAALLHKRLMGPQVHAVHGASSEMRSFAHCRPAGGNLTVMLLNPTDEEQSVLFVESLGAGGVYLLTAADEADPLSAKQVKINGQLMEAPSGKVPPLPEAVAAAAGKPIAMPKYAAAFVTFGFAPCAKSSGVLV